MAGTGRTPASHWVLLFEIQDHSREREVPSSKALRQEQLGELEGWKGLREQEEGSGLFWVSWATWSFWSLQRPLATGSGLGF